jgi:hypothetical protein
MIKQKTYEALRILAAAPLGVGMAASTFANLYWPKEHPIHTRVKRNGVRGCGAWLSAGSLLSKLSYKGLVNKHGPAYSIRREGLAAIKEFETHLTQKQP